MKTIYRKTGVTTRLEWTPPSRAIIEISEKGQARFEDGAFVAESLTPDADIPSRVPAAMLESFAARVAEFIPHPVRLGRLVVAAGTAFHHIDGDGSPRSWIDSNARCFASLELPDTPLQLELDLGAAQLDGIDLAPLRSAADAMRTYRGDMAPPEQFRLAPIVAAALWRALSQAHAAAPAARLVQSSHPDFGVDGIGLPVKRRLTPPWPNSYRPSYRSAPVTMPFHLDIETTTIDIGDAPAVIALVEPLRIAENELVMVGLCVDDGAAFRTVVRLAPDAWLRSVQGVSGSATWFPFEAGSWGRNVRIAPTRA